MKFGGFFLLSLMASAAAVYEKAENDNEELEADNKLAKQWAVLVAGSDGWWNYRHQADICHAYQLLIKRGVPASNIIVFMKDDIAHNSENPRPGVIINRPNGTNVYEGVKIDYKGSDLTPKNFLNVILGKKHALRGIGSGRVLESGPNDNVFINFANHGGPGLLCFPNAALGAKDFIKTLNQLTKKKAYGKLVLYVEACESGSMFDNLLPQHTRILASTASAYDESSWGYYCDYDDYPCLGDLYSINWMEHLDKKISNKEDLFHHYQLVRTLTSKSHVNLYGDFTIGSTTSKNFIGPHNVKQNLTGNDNNDLEYHKTATAVPSRDIPLYWMKRMAKNSRNSTCSSKYAKMASKIEKKRVQIDNVINKIIMYVAFRNKNFKKSIEKSRKKLQMNMLTCYENLYRLFSKKCFNMFKNPYVINHFYKFANICQMDTTFQQRTTHAINSMCHSSFSKNVHSL